MKKLNLKEQIELLEKHIEQKQQLLLELTQAETKAAQDYQKISTSLANRVKKTTESYNSLRSQSNFLSGIQQAPQMAAAASSCLIARQEHINHKSAERLLRRQEFKAKQRYNNTSKLRIKETNRLGVIMKQLESNRLVYKRSILHKQKKQEARKIIREKILLEVKSKAND